MELNLNLEEWANLRPNLQFSRLGLVKWLNILNAFILIGKWF